MSSIKPTPLPDRPSMGDADLAEMAAAGQVVQGRAQFGEGENTVDHRFQRVRGHGCGHLNEIRAATHGDALQPDMSRNHRPQGHIHGTAPQHTDQADRPANPDRPQGLGQCGLATHIDDMVDAVSTSDLTCPPAPFRHLAVVDGLVRAEPTHAGQLFIAGGNDDGAGAPQFGELQGEERHTARALNQHCVVLFDAAFAHQGAPGGHRRRTEASRFHSVQMSRCRRNAQLGQDHEVGHGAIDLAAQTLRQARLGRRAVDPGLEEQRADPIAHGQVLHALTDPVHDAHAVAEHDQRQGFHARSITAPRHEQVAVVEGRGPHAYPHLARAGNGIRPRGQTDVVHGPVIFYLEDSHGVSLHV
ncbi:hypothetical protein DESC_610315 [Desulfosarcina cetonica]|nr:hypothetical protein DESC_610315 [Desulfosarcina cetonica]